MLQNINPSQTDAWSKLEELYDETKFKSLIELFQDDPNRFERYSLRFENLLLDYSKNHLDDDIRAALLELTEEVNLKDGIEAMFSGAPINATEDRAVLHTALRVPESRIVEVDGHNVVPQIYAVRQRMQEFSNEIHTGVRFGHTGKKITHIINIGIGGSDLGPVMVTEALKPYWIEGIQANFVSNIDGSHISEVLKTADPETVLFVIASKTFTTQETMTNARTAREWLLGALKDKEAIGKHFIALSTNVDGAVDFGIQKENIFPFWDWVGGRFSISSAIGMSVILTIGYDHFSHLLDGLHSMDEHFRTAPLNENLPVLMALTGIWYNNFYGVESEAILPYDQYLHRFAAYFQQANMESNGKSIDRNGLDVFYQTGPIIWGEPGTNGQHAFYQLIHQGTKIVHCDFIAPAISQNPIGDHHNILLSNFFAQTEALMNGKDEAAVIEDFEKAGVPQSEYAPIVPFKIFDGDRPSNSILVKKIDPYTLGQLIALYEHKIFAQGYIWNIYSFDQWGVQLGKVLAKQILPELENDDQVTSHDSSTNGLINAYKEFRK